MGGKQRSETSRLTKTRYNFSDQLLLSAFGYDPQDRVRETIFWTGLDLSEVDLFEGFEGELVQNEGRREVSLKSERVFTCSHR